MPFNYMLLPLNKYKCKCVASMLLLLFIFTAIVQAQSSSDYVYIDSTLAETDTAQNEDNYNVAPDTFLTKNTLHITQSWLTIVRSDKDVAYSTTLQTKLQQLQKETAEKQQKTSNNTSWLASIFTSIITQAIFWVLGAILILFVLYKLYNAGSFFTNNGKKAAIVHHVNDINSSSGSEDVQQSLLAAKSNKNYRLAIRYLFLQTLQKLAVQNIITLHADKTNQFYLQQVYGKPYALDFSVLIQTYEYVWYGAYTIDEDKFVQLEDKFHLFNQRIIAA